MGLSATLPNFADVAEFLHVSPEPGKGLFFCDDSFRPVPLTQRFLGVTVGNKARAVEKMYELAFDRSVEELLAGKQAMVFVHSRKDTMTTAMKLLEYAAQEGKETLFTSPREHAKFEYFKQRVQRSHNRQLQDLFPRGLAIHHAGDASKRPELGGGDVFRGSSACVVLYGDLGVGCESSRAWGDYQGDGVV